MKPPALGILYAAMLACLSPISHASNKEFVPVIVYGVGGKFDKSFNEASFRGVERFKKDTGISYREGNAGDEVRLEQTLRNLAHHSPDIIITVGFNLSETVGKVAADYPAIKFTIADGLAEGSNVSAIAYKEQEGSFLVGMAAALASHTGKIGFIGGMDAPTIRAFSCGYLQGARYINPKIVLLQDMVGTSSDAFHNPDRAALLAKGQFDAGADVIFAAAGSSGLGVLQLAAKEGKLSIGVDSNQNYLYPGSVLTSMVKRIDNTLYDTLMDARNGRWKAGQRIVGLKENAVGWSLDQYNRKLITAQMEKRINAAQKDIIEGRLSVADYRDKNSCPLQ